MADGYFRIQGFEEFKRAAVVLRETGGGPGGIDGDVRKMLLKELRAAGRPAALAIKAAWQAEMPQSGGLADRLGGARVAVRNRLTGKTAGTSIAAIVPGWDLDAIETGKIRHPVYGSGDRKDAEVRKKWKWVLQDVPAHVAGEAFAAMEPAVQARVNLAVETVIASVEARI